MSRRDGHRAGAVWGGVRDLGRSWLPPQGSSSRSAGLWAAFPGLRVGARSQAYSRDVQSLQADLEDADALTSGSRWANSPDPRGTRGPPPPPHASFQSNDLYCGGLDTQSSPRWQQFLSKAGVIPECPSPPGPTRNAPGSLGGPPQRGQWGVLP